eukprot:TRINITY_DN4117_c2_g1_i2.p1 TRINITY_DN4117_c2_g1~~TRINITY_DN4117_c2_g1_i2.p1  ORF type:complete len:664 (+),score=89.40 TRINITY_DN4117_c2_g1_i2:87-1994(+)
MGVNAKIVFSVHMICILLLLLIVILNYELQHNFTSTTDTNLKTLRLATELRQSSDDLTRFVRTYTVTGNASYWDYFNDVIAIRDGKIPLPIDPHRIYWDLYVVDGPPRTSTEPLSLDARMKAAGFTEEELALVTLAKERSDALIDLENVAYHAMIGKYRPTDSHASGLNTSGLTSEQLLEFSVSGQPDQDYAMRLVHGLDYHREKARIMKPIDDFFVLSEDRISDLDEISREGDTLSALGFGVIGILSALAIYASVDHWKSLSTVDSLFSAQVMASKTADALSGFRLSEVEYLNDLKEPDELQQAFIAIVANLKMYKTYLPSHLVDGDSDSETVISASDRKSTCTQKSLTSGGTPQTRIAGAGSRLALGLERRATTIVAVTNSFVEASLHKSDFHAISHGFSQLSNWLYQLANKTKGLLSLSPEGVYFITYRGKISAAVELVHRSRKELSSMNVSVGCCHGKDVCGNVGGEHQRAHVNLGTSMHVAETLSTLAHRVGLDNLIEQTTAESVPNAVTYYRCKLRLFENGNLNPVEIRVHSLIDISETTQEEWMYYLDRNRNPISDINESIKFYFDTGKREHLEQVPRTLSVANHRIDLTWIHDVSPLPVYNCFVGKIVPLHPDQAAGVAQDTYRNWS